MDKAILRNKLFDKYFESKDGILVTDLVDKLSFIPELWKKLHIMCENSLEYFDSFSTLEKMKVIEHKQKKYLILKLRLFEYVIIDMEEKNNITEEQFESEFNEDFFVNNFDEVKEESDLFDLYHVNKYEGNVQELIDFYSENSALLSVSTSVHYKLEIGEALTYFYIDFANASAQMGFQTPDQFLYEHLLLNYDLSPFGMQDAQGKIGVERMYEMFEEIKKVRIPKEVIPNDLYQEYLKLSDTNKWEHEKVKIK